MSDNHKQKAISRMAMSIAQACIFERLGVQPLPDHVLFTMAEYAYESSGAQRIPALVEALRIIASHQTGGDVYDVPEEVDHLTSTAQQALAALPDEMKGGE